MKILFTKNLYDIDGDCIDECIILHFGDNTMIKVKDSSELSDIINNLVNIKNEINETY